MKRLAIDTSSEACSAALCMDGNVVEKYAEKPREHTRLLMPMIRELLDDAGVSIGDLDHIVLGNGPGSFIGMRIAASVAQGLAHGAGISIVPVSSLAAVAAEVMLTTDAKHVAVAQDAHMNEVYLGLFARNDDRLPAALSAERLQSAATISEISANGSPPFVAAGAGWQRYPDLLAMNQRGDLTMSPVRFPRSRYLLQLATALGDAAMPPANVEPAYLRQKVAQKPKTAGS